jgi:hypothetical protein
MCQQPLGRLGLLPPAVPVAAKVIDLGFEDLDELPCTGQLGFGRRNADIKGVSGSRRWGRLVHHVAGRWHGVGGLALDVVDAAQFRWVYLVSTIVTPGR